MRFIATAKFNVFLRQDGVRYWLLPSVTQIRRTSAGVLSANAVSCKKMKQVGTQAAEETPELTLKYQASNGQERNYSTPVPVTTGMEWIKFNLYSNATLVDTVTIHIVSDGKQGAYPRITKWVDDPVGTVYYPKTNDYYNIVYYKNVYYLCIKQHTKTATNNPQANPSCWIASNMKFVASEVILGDQGIFNLLYGQSFIVRRADGTRASELDSDSLVFFYNDGVTPAMAIGQDGFTKYTPTGSVAWTFGNDGNINRQTTDDWRDLKLRFLGTDRLQAETAAKSSTGVLAGCTLVEAKVYDKGTTSVNIGYDSGYTVKKNGWTAVIADCTPIADGYYAYNTGAFQEPPGNYARFIYHYAGGYLQDKTKVTF